MGAIIKAKCECGFESKEICEGGGFQNFQTTDMQPAICPKCKKFLVKNYMEKPQKCPNCGTKIIFYFHDPTVKIKIIVNEKNNDSVNKTKFYFPDTKFLCPKCGKMTLRFIYIGMWD